MLNINWLWFTGMLLKVGCRWNVKFLPVMLQWSVSLSTIDGTLLVMRRWVEYCMLKMRRSLVTRRLPHSYKIYIHLPLPSVIHIYLILIFDWLNYDYVTYKLVYPSLLVVEIPALSICFFFSQQFSNFPVHFFRIFIFLPFFLANIFLWRVIFIFPAL